jgi:GTP cyclohydrolase I
MRMAKKIATIEDHVAGLLKFIEPLQYKREGLVDTPRRVVEMYKEVFSGYDMAPKDILKTTFTRGENRSSQYSNGLVTVRDIEFYSHCEHHMVPFFGSVDIGYIPRDKVVGISKLARLVDCFSKRLQIQERMTDQIIEAIQEYLEPEGAAVVVRAHHLCMCMRGVRNKAQTVTSRVSGVLASSPTARGEFFIMARGDK